MRLIRRSDNTLRQYVLGELREPPRLAIEERLITDPEFFETLGLAEEELTEDYLEGTLSAADAERFERHYLADPERRRHLAFIQMLKTYATSHRTAASVTDRPRISELIRFHPVWASAAAAVLAILVVGNVWLVMGNYRLQGEFDQVRTQQGREEELRQQLQRQVAGLTAQADTLVNRLDGRPGAGGELPTFSLTHGRLRAAASSTERITIPAGAQHVRLQLQLPGDNLSPDRATLLDEGGDTIWLQSKLKAETISGGTAAVVVLIPTGVLSPGEYQLKLSGTVRGNLEGIATYWFRVNAP